MSWRVQTGMTRLFESVGCTQMRLGPLPPQVGLHVLLLVCWAGSAALALKMPEVQLRHLAQKQSLTGTTLPHLFLLEQKPLAPWNAQFHLSALVPGQ